jgi:hypothetical protein
VKACSDPDLADRLRRFEVVCKVTIQLSTTTHRTTSGKHPVPGGNLIDNGSQHFGLTPSQVRYCTGRARNFLDDIRTAERARNNAINFKGVRTTKYEWRYLDDVDSLKACHAVAPPERRRAA